MKRIVLLLVCILLASTLFATDLLSFNGLAFTKTDTINMAESQRVALGVGGQIKFHSFEDFSMAPPFTYGFFVSSDISFAVDGQKGNEENAQSSLEGGGSAGPLLAIDMEAIHLIASIGPSFYIQEHLNDEGEETGDSIYLGFYGDVMAHVGLLGSWGLNAGVQCYWNLVGWDTDPSGNSSSTNTTSKHFVPGIYVGITRSL